MLQFLSVGSTCVHTFTCSVQYSLTSVISPILPPIERPSAAAQYRRIGRNVRNAPSVRNVANDRIVPTDRSVLVRVELVDLEQERALVELEVVDRVVLAVQEVLVVTMVPRDPVVRDQVKVHEAPDLDLVVRGWDRVGPDREVRDLVDRLAQGQ